MSHEAVIQCPFMKTPVLATIIGFAVTRAGISNVCPVRQVQPSEPEFQTTEACSLLCGSQLPAPETPAGGQSLPLSLSDLGQVLKPSEPPFLHL